MENILRIGRYRLLLGAVLLILLISSVSSCGETQGGKKIGIIKWNTHPALDEFEKSFIDCLDSVWATTSVTSKFSISSFSANGKEDEAKSIARSLAMRDDIAIVVAIGTNAATAAADVLKVPLLYGAVADPIGAKIIPKKNVTGIQNAGPSIIRKAIDFVLVAFPSVKKIGTIYNSNEPNSIYVQGLLKNECLRSGLDLTQISIQNVNQIVDVAEKLAVKVDLIYSANDNLVNNGILPLISLTNEKKIPVLIGDLSTLSSGPLFAVGLEYKSMGRSLALIANEILAGKSISEFPPMGPPQAEIWFNENSANIIGYNIPDSAIRFVDRFVK